MSGVGRNKQPVGNEDLGGKVAVLEQKVKDLEEHLAEAAGHPERGEFAELERKVRLLEDRLQIGASRNGGDPELGEVEEPAQRQRGGGIMEHTDSKPSATVNHEADEGFYELKLSMWDAGLLLALNENSHFDKVVLVVGMLLNMGLQILMFSLIVHTLLDNDFSSRTVEEMMAWRVDHGHSTAEFDVAAGESKVRKLCQHDLWSYEGNAYEEMYAYLYLAIPGYYLTALAVTLWVLTTMREFREAVSAYLSLVNLAVTPYNERVIMEEAGGDLVICGISAPARIAALVMLVLPRMTIAICLMFVGCKYLAQTVTLSDIVLNTVGLAFVMDVDEQLAGVLLTERLQTLMKKIKPLSCGPPSALRGRVRAIVRYAMAVGMIAFALSYWVLPFRDNVNAAATALCGGDLEFSFSGGTELSPDITLRPATIIFDEYQAECPTSANQTYLSTYYPQFDVSSLMDGDGAGVGNATSRNLRQERMREVLRYAFSADECGDGRIRAPPKDTMLSERTFFDMIFRDGGGGKNNNRGDFANGQCEEFPDNLRGPLPDGVHPGRDPIVEECSRFNISLHEHACVEPEHPGVCRWSWEAERCEGTEYPGVVFQSACRSDVWDTCMTWVSFNTSHPTRDCDEMIQYCSEAFPRCLAVSGTFEVNLRTVYGNARVGHFAGRETAVRELISNAFERTLSADPWVTAHFQVFVRGAPCQCEAPCQAQAGWCYVANPGCQGDMTVVGWYWRHVTWCAPDCNSTDGDEATEFRCVCGDARCDAGTSCVADNGTCLDDAGVPTATTTTTEAPEETWSCTDLDFDAIQVDLGGDHCDWYSGRANECAWHDSPNFNARTLCCVCGGGGRPAGGAMPACADPRDSCIVVAYSFIDINPALPIAELLAANGSIAEFMTVNLTDTSFWGLAHSGFHMQAGDRVHLRFNETSVHLYPSHTPASSR